MNMNRNDKASRTLQAILASTDDEEQKETQENEVTSEETNEVTEDEDEIEEETSNDEEPEEVEEDNSDEDEEPEEIEEITEEEVESAREEMEDEDEDEIEEETSNDEEPEEIEEVMDENEEEPEEIEEITEEEVESAREEMEDSSDDEEPEEVEEDNSDEDEEPEEITEEELEEVPDEEATAEAVAALAKLNFGCSTDDMGRIIVTSCGDNQETEACNCGSPECPECKETTTVIRPVSEDEKPAKEDVACVLTAAEGSSPFYTVLIKGMPVAAIHLEDQPNAEAIRAYFLSNTYSDKLATAMAVEGAKAVLDNQNARMFTASVNNTEIAKNMKAEAKAEFDKQLAESVIAHANKFNESLKLAIEGMNKNFFKEENDLKGAAYAHFSALGLDENVATAKANAIISESGSFFSTAIAKAQELMGLSDEAFKEIASMISNAGVASQPVKTFANALEQGNNPIIAGVVKETETIASAKTDDVVALVKSGKKIFGRI